MALLAPIFNDAQLINGIPANGAKLFTYVAGSTTKQTTYTDEAGLTPQANPIILDSRGEPAQPIWLLEGQTYKFVFSAPTDTDPPTSPIRTIDNISGINDTSVTVSQWVDVGLTPTYVNATQFTLVGDQTSRFTVNRRVKCTVTAGTVYGYISASVFTALTTITVVLDSGVLDDGLSDVQIGIITPTNTSLPQIPNFVTTAMLQTDSVTIPKLADSTFGAVMTNGYIVASVAANALTIAIKTLAGTDPSATDPVIVVFRNATLTNGSYVVRSVTAATSLVVPNGATLGTTNNVQASLNALLIDNAGTVELAIQNPTKQIQLNENGVITTEAISTSSDTTDNIFSTAIRSNVAYRNACLIQITEATAGVWATSYTLISPYTYPPITAGTAIAPVTGQSLGSAQSVINTQQIPAWARRITIMVADLSTNGTSPVIIQLGDSGGFETSGYIAAAGTFAGTSASASFTTGFAVTDTIAAATSLTLVATLHLVDRASNLWFCTGVGHAGVSLRVFSGYKTLSGTLTDIQFTTVGGANTFDAGSPYYFVE